MAQERPPLEEMTLRQLRKIASDCNIYRYSRKRKQELLLAIQKVMQVKTINTQEKENMEPSKFELIQAEETKEKVSIADNGQQVLPDGYGESRIVLMPRDAQWAYVYWDIPNEHKQELRSQGGRTLILRLYDVTDIDINSQVPHSVQEYLCDELAREWHLPVPVSNRDYIIDIGYRTFDGNWLILARSMPVHIPPLYPSEWIEDVFVTVEWEEDLRGKTVYQLVTPEQKKSLVYSGSNASLETATDKPSTAPQESRFFGGDLRYATSDVSPEAALSSYILAPGVGSWAMPTVSGRVGITTGASYVQVTNASGVGMVRQESRMSGAGMMMSGVGMSGFSGSLAPKTGRPRKFWLVADAELIVYGATEPDATVTIGGRPIKLNEDGTFRFQMSFPDGLIDYPIMAVAIDGEQTRSIHMKFDRETPDRNTNTKEEAVLEWL